MTKAYILPEKYEDTHVLKSVEIKFTSPLQVQRPRKLITQQTEVLLGPKALT